jgi:formylglycine-generating enzyme required for sulfatase activity
MLRITTDAGTFCIDTTETSNIQYAQFLQAVGDGPGAQPPECAAAPSHRPATGVPLDYLPVANVNWCDAYAYCRWAGKRLCGEIGGAGNVSAWTSAADDEWYAACTRAGTRMYPYGPAYQPAACNGGGPGIVKHTVSVASMPTCVGGYDGLFDMSGNVWEWEASCTTTANSLADPCHARGGGWISSPMNLACNANSSLPENFGGGLLRGGRSPLLGIRCCAD